VADPGCRYELVVVSYRSRQPLSRLLAAVDGVPVIVVDNAADIDGVQDLTSTRSSVRYVDAHGNLGFAAAANLGASVSDADVLVFVNPDCLPTVPVLDQLAGHVCGEDEVASCAPALVDAAGHLSRQAGGWAPTVGRCLVPSVGGHLVLRRRGIWISPRPGEVCELEWLAGTCLAVRRSTFQDVGGFDESYFLYNEDMALGDRLRARGMRQVLRADLSVEHEGGGSSAGPSRALWRLRAASLSRYIGQHNRPIATFCMRSVLAAGALVRAGLMSALPGRGGRRQEMVTYVGGTLRPHRATEIAVSSLLGVHGRATATAENPPPRH
jgi:N-acetylglucosaminyl-diphospho-decaprenol L-rhamnosyltransferase